MFQCALFACRGNFNVSFKKTLKPKKNCKNLNLKKKNYFLFLLMRMTSNSTTLVLVFSSQISNTRHVF